MAAKKELVPNYWSVYKAINFSRISKHREFIDTDSGKKMSYSFGRESEKFDFFLSFCSFVIWSSPAFLVLLLSGIYGQETLWAFPLGAITIIGYHFLGMYYVIRGPFTTYHEERKKRGFFGI